MNNQNIFRKLYDFFLNHFVIFSFIIFFNIFYILLILIFKSNIFSRNQDYIILSKVNIYIFFAITFVSFILIQLKLFGDKYNNYVKDNGLFIFEDLIDSINTLKERRLNGIINYLDNVEFDNKLESFLHNIKSEEQIEFIIEHIKSNFSAIFGIPIENIGICIIYYCCKEDKWKWIKKDTMDNELELDDMVLNKKTTAFKMISSERDLIFYPDKRIGIHEGEYFNSKKDDMFNCIGSILCKDISIKSKKLSSKAILCITTYNFQLCSTNDLSAIYKIENIIVPIFSLRLKLELSLIFLKGLQ